jgi:pyridoxine 5-phosphate synthase
MTSKYRLGINIDHVATLRNARGGVFPSVNRAALEVIKSGADSITVHLREDQRHIKTADVISLKKVLKKPLNLEMALTEKMVSFAIKIKPKFVCLVPEKRKELTTEGGLNLLHNYSFLKKTIKKLQSKNILVSLFIDPKIKTAQQAYKLNANNIEIHTGAFCNYIEEKKTLKAKKEFNKIQSVAKFASKKNMGVHCGHGLNYITTKKIKKILEITEYNIGHFVISESIFNSLSKTVKQFLKIIKK